MAGAPSNPPASQDTAAHGAGGEVVVGAGVIDEAAQRLSRGELVVLATDTVYGLFALAADARGGAGAGVAALLELRRAAGVDGPPATWHAGSVARALEVLEIAQPVHQHVVRALAPGAVRFVAEIDDDARRARVRARLGEACLRDEGTHAIASVRILGASAAASVLGHPLLGGAIVVGERASIVADPAFADASRLGVDAGARGAALGVAMVVDAGPAPGVGSTAIRLTREGWYRVASVGAVPAERVRMSVEQSILFVCTGNTCRSPMAEALARHALAQHGAVQQPTRVASAGVSAYDGDAMTREAREALGMMGVDAGTHKATHLTSAMVREASVVYAMTKAHAARARELLGDAALASKVVLLDPAGKDVEDPIGGPLELYKACAGRLRELVEGRLRERGVLR